MLKTLKNNLIIKTIKYDFFYVYNKSIIQPLLSHIILQIIYHRIYS